VIIGEYVLSYERNTEKIKDILLVSDDARLLSGGG